MRQAEHTEQREKNPTSEVSMAMTICIYGTPGTVLALPSPEDSRKQNRRITTNSMVHRGGAHEPILRSSCLGVARDVL
jgi:hypothetical protein